MNAAQIQRAEMAGVRLWREGESLRYAGKADALAGLLPALKASRAELLALLAANQPFEVETARPELLPSDLTELAARVCLWRIPGEPSRFIMAGPDHDLREQHPDAVPLFDEAHRERVRRIAKCDEAPLPKGMLDALAERAAILEHDAGESREDAERSAVRPVQCRRCHHFTPDPMHPLAGIGACAVGGWAQAAEREHVSRNDVPNCDLFEARP